MNRTRKEVTGRRPLRPAREAGASASARPHTASSKAERQLPCAQGYVVAVLERSAAAGSAVNSGVLAAARALAARKHACALVAVSDEGAAQLKSFGVDRTLLAQALPPQACAEWLEAVRAELGASHVVLAATPASNDIARRLAALGGHSVAIGVIDLREGGAIRRSPRPDRQLCGAVPVVLTVEPGAAEDAVDEPGQALPLALQTRLPAGAGVVQLHPAESLTLRADELPLDQAPFVVGAGAGLNDWDAFQRFAARVGACVGGSRVACDRGLLPRERQIGASGTKLAAQFYIATGISGAIQHLAGIEDCQHVVAVNRDPSAPIFQRAELGIVCDADSLLASVLEQLGVEVPR